MEVSLNIGKTILSLCDYSGAWIKPYRDAGYNCIKIDLKLGQDVRLVKVSELPKIHGILAAPPCTHFAIIGAVHWEKKGVGPLIEGLGIVDACMRIILATEPEWWCLENPVGRLKYYLGDYAMSFQPCEYGDPYTKKTCLWGNFNTGLPKTIVEPKHAKITSGRKSPGKLLTAHTLGTGEARAAHRSLTPPGFAKAFFEANR